MATIAIKIEIEGPYGTDMYLARNAKEFAHYWHRRYGLTKLEYKAAERFYVIMLGHKLTTVDYPS